MLNFRPDVAMIYDTKRLMVAITRAKGRAFFSCTQNNVETFAYLHAKLALWRDNMTRRFRNPGVAKIGLTPNPHIRHTGDKKCLNGDRDSENKRINRNNWGWKVTLMGPLSLLDGLWTCWIPKATSHIIPPSPMCSIAFCHAVATRSCQTSPHHYWHCEVFYDQSEGWEHVPVYVIFRPKLTIL